MKILISGAGFDVAERMGLVPEILRRGYKVNELREVDRSGKRVGGFSIDVLDRLTQGRYSSLPRGELAACLYRALGTSIETIFGDGIARLDAAMSQISVEFHNSSSRSFDLVIGADGLHSQVRRLVFGNDARFERFLHMKVAAFSVEKYRPRDELVYLIHRQVGQQIGRFSMRDDRTMFLFVFADDDPAIPTDVSAQKAILRERFSESGWECAGILDALECSADWYMDRVSQVRLDRWQQGRVALVGDAAFCVSLLGGQGCALAMLAAYILAGELKHAGGDHEAAFGRYEHRLRDFLSSKQEAALAVGRQIRDRLELPEY